MEVNVNVHGKINSIGTVGNSFLEELK